MALKTYFSSSGSSAPSVPTTITVANEASDTSCFPLFATAATGDLGPKTNAALTFNSNVPNLGCTTFTGNLTGHQTTTEQTGTSQAAAVNNTYIANNAALVTVTLPTVAAVGDTLTVIGSGAGGWRIAQNASQEIKVTAGGVDGTNETTAGVGGSLSSADRYDSITLICLATTNVWGIVSFKSAGFTLV